MSNLERAPDPQLLGFLEAYDRHVADVALALREIILDEAPDVAELIYQAHELAIWFGFSEKSKDLFCYITVHYAHVNLGFPYGAALPDPNRVMLGSGKTMRHVKFASMSDVERPFLRRYVRTAADAVGSETRGPAMTVIKTRGDGDGSTTKRATPSAKRAQTRK